MKGREIKEQQLDFFEIEQADFLAICRSAAIMYAQEHGTVSINEVRTLVPVPKHIHPSCLGAVFRTKEFTACGYTEANHPQAHARVVRIYKLKEKKIV